MKPHLYRWRGVWCCRQFRSLAFFPHPIGHGYTPKQAYDDWKEQT